MTLSPRKLRAFAGGKQDFIVTNLHFSACAEKPGNLQTSFSPAGQAGGIEVDDPLLWNLLNCNEFILNH